NALFPNKEGDRSSGLDRARELGERCVGAGDLAEVLAGRAFDEDEALGPPFSTYEVSCYFESRANGGRSRVSFGAADAPLLGFVTDEKHALLVHLCDRRPRRVLEVIVDEIWRVVGTIRCESLG